MVFGGKMTSFSQISYSTYLSPNTVINKQDEIKSNETAEKETEEKQQLAEEKYAEHIRRVLVNHSFRGFENYICVVISTESTVLVRSGYSFVVVEVKV